MLKPPVALHESVREYIYRHTVLLPIEPLAEDDDFVSFSYVIDYRNFIALATRIGGKFMKRGFSHVIQSDASFFMDIVRAEIIDVALRRLHARIYEEKMNGELAELYSSFCAHDVVLSDMLKLNSDLKTYNEMMESIERKLDLHGGQVAVKALNNCINDISENMDITIQVDVRPETWSMFFDYRNRKCLFFQAPASDDLFVKILNPVMIWFYNNFV